VFFLFLGASRVQRGKCERRYFVPVQGVAA
jgi:hypothetical protein